MSERKLEGVVFDLDGVLVTTDTFHYQAWKMLADNLGLDFDEEVNHQLRGVSRVESLTRIYRHNKKKLPPDDEFEAQMTMKNDKYKELIGTMTPDDILPGSIELLTALREAGIKCAIASASKNTPKVLEVTGLDTYVDGVADGNQAKKSKPDPEVFLLAAQNIGCAPENCIGVEDAESGVEAIQRAGMVAVGIGKSAEKAELVVDNVSQLSVEILKRIFDGKQQH
jgi:beta-phosphoglucomutase